MTEFKKEDEKILNGKVSEKMKLSPVSIQKAVLKTFQSRKELGGPSPQTKGKLN